jgi:hypothetical protein
LNHNLLWAKELQKVIFAELNLIYIEFVTEDEPQEQGDQGEDGSVRESIEDPQLLEQLNQIAFYNAVQENKIRFCTHCQKFKVIFFDNYLIP